MTGEERTLRWALGGSLAAHVIVLAFFITFSGGGSPESVKVYTIRILESAARPVARELTLSTQAISALRLDSPSLSAVAPPPAEADSPEIPESEKIPTEMPAISGRPPPPPPAAPGSPAALPSVLAPPGNQSPPALPPAPPSGPSQPALPPSPRVIAPPQAPPVLPLDDAPARKSLLQKLGEKIGKLKLEVAAEPPTAPGRQQDRREGERNMLISLKIFQNAVREAVKPNYKFVRSFDPELRARVRVALNRDGSVNRIELVESSGDRNFDNLVCLARIFNSKLPPVPDDIPNDPLTLVITCKP